MRTQRTEVHIKDCIVLRADARFKTTVLFTLGKVLDLVYLLGTITVTRGQAVDPLASVCH